MLLVAECRDVAVEDFLQLLSLGVVVNHLTLNELSHLHFFFTIEGVGFWCTILALLTTDDVVVAKELNHLFHLVLDVEARSLHIVDKERGYIIQCGREDQLVGLRDVADHEEHVGYSHGKTGALWSVGLVSASHAQSIIHSLLSTSLQSFFEHVIIEFVERDELAQLSICICLGSRVDYLDDASLVTFYLLGHIAEVEERVENLHNQLKLIRHERVVVHEIIL